MDTYGYIVLVIAVIAYFIARHYKKPLGFWYFLMGCSAGWLLATYTAYLVVMAEMDRFIGTLK